MTTLELEQVIREYIRDMINAEYIGKIHIEKLDPIGYSVKLGLDVPEKPKVICGMLDDDTFIKYLKKELKACLFHLSQYKELKLIYPLFNCGQPYDNRCNCKCNTSN